MRKLRSLEATATPCNIDGDYLRRKLLASRPFSAIQVNPIVRIPRLVDIASSKIRDYIDKGGDWTVLQELPDHLLHKIASSHPSQPVETQILEFGYNKTFIVEKVKAEELKGTRWSVYHKKKRKIK